MKSLIQASVLLQIVLVDIEPQALTIAQFVRPALAVVQRDGLGAFHCQCSQISHR
jgi:hypothetical protein